CSVLPYRSLTFNSLRKIAIKQNYADHPNSYNSGVPFEQR
ncbi:MAG: hypothetical protein ACI9EZ_001291, partial [Halobacteriales archaeon]